MPSNMAANTNHTFLLKIQSAIKYLFKGSIGHVTYSTRFSVSPQSCSPFSASLQTFCLTVRANLNTQKYGLFCSLEPLKGRLPFLLGSQW